MQRQLNIFYIQIDLSLTLKLCQLLIYLKPNAKNESESTIHKDNQQIHDTVIHLPFTPPILRPMASFVFVQPPITSKLRASAAGLELVLGQTLKGKRRGKTVSWRVL